MSVQEILLFFTRSAFIVLSIISIMEDLRYRGAIRRDIALMLVSIATPIAIPLLNELLSRPIPFLTSVGSIVLMGQPYQMLRLLSYFQPISQQMLKTAKIIMLLSIASIIILGANLP